MLPLPSSQPCPQPYLLCNLFLARLGLAPAHDSLAYSSCTLGLFLLKGILERPTSITLSMLLTLEVLLLLDSLPPCCPDIRSQYSAETAYPWSYSQESAIMQC